MNGTTPYSERLQITFIGRRNVGKSSIINMIAGQAVSIVSEVPGTTTDPVRKPIELPGLGACVLVDTAGLDDEGELGSMRASVSAVQVPSSDIVVLVLARGGTDDLGLEKEVVGRLREEGIPFLVVLNKADGLIHGSDEKVVERELGIAPILSSAAEQSGSGEILAALLEKVPLDFGSQSLLGGLASRGDLVVLVMPQDSEAPKGRLILPQSMAVRELLDAGCTAVCCTPDTFEASLSRLGQEPDLVIADSSVFKLIAPLVPEGTAFTSFSILMAAYKGDLDYFVEGASRIGSLEPGSKVLIAESCSHVSAGEDIGRVKIPALLRKTVGDVEIDVVSGRDFPEDLSGYSLVIHCGGCMFSRRHLMSRVSSARRQGVPMTNYGIALAHMSGILGKVVLPGHLCSPPGTR